MCRFLFGCCVLLVVPAFGIRTNQSKLAAEESMRIVAPAMSKPGKMFFLFTANNTLPNHKVWQTFFRNHKRGEDYEAILHCQDEVACRDKYSSFADVVYKVRQIYCVDLISPMLNMLQHALSSKYLSRGPDVGASERDLFIFISDTAVPIKPFQRMQTLFRELRGKSSMCLAPWGTGKHGYVDGGVAVKHSQWIVLSREHASLSVNKTPLSVPLNREQRSKFWQDEYPGADFHNGCLDEFWFYHRIFGPLHVDTAVTRRTVQDLTAQQYLSALSKVDGLDRRCFTFFDMSKTINDKLAIGEPVPHAPVFKGRDGQSYNADSELVLTYNRTSFFGPARIEYLSLKHLREWMESPLAFIRKVDGNTQIEGGISLHQALESTWR